MKKRSKLLVAVVALLGIGMTSLVACGGSTPKESSTSQVEMYAISWTVGEHATVNVEGYEGLPDTVAEDTAITFTVTVDNGFDVDEVTANGRRISLRNDTYTVGVTRDMEIVIKISEAVGQLTIISNPTKLSYIAGEQVDLTGFVLQATLGTGQTVTVPQGGSDGYTYYPTTFEGGETAIEVTYKKQTINIPLEAVVEYSVTIDANGGEFTDAYLASLQARNLHNYKHENGVITFTYYDDLTTAVAMPKKNDVVRENYSLTGWGTDFTDASISNATKANVNVKASWQLELVEISAVSLEKEGDIPYLIIEGTFRAATEVYLYLYEGNAHVELKGDTYTGTSNQPFEVKFDLTRLSDKGADYKGKWMDIRFNASVGETVQSMEIFVNASSNIQVDTSQKILAGSYSYIFAIYDSRLKVYFQEAVFAYEVMGHAVDNKDYLRFSGHTNNSEHANKYIVISAWNDSSETDGFGANIDAEGNFVVEYALEDFAGIIEKNIFFHATIYSDSTKSEIIYGGITTNVAVADVFTSMPALETNLGDIHHAFLYTGSDGLKYYIGYAWDGLMLYIVE